MLAARASLTMLAVLEFVLSVIRESPLLRNGHNSSAFRVRVPARFSQGIQEELLAGKMGPGIQDRVASFGLSEVTMLLGVWVSWDQDVDYPEVVGPTTKALKANHPDPISSLMRSQVDAALCEGKGLGAIVKRMVDPVIEAVKGSTDAMGDAARTLSAWSSVHAELCRFVGDVERRMQCDKDGLAHRRDDVISSARGR